jgi:hypothetical protein
MRPIQSYSEKFGGPGHSSFSLRLPAKCSTVRALLLQKNPRGF